MNRLLFPVGSGGASIIAYFNYGVQYIDKFPLLEHWSIQMYNAFMKVPPCTLHKEAKRIIYSIFNMQVSHDVNNDDDEDFINFCNNFIESNRRFEFVPLFPDLRIALRNIIVHTGSFESFVAHLNPIFDRI